MKKINILIFLVIIGFTTGYSQNWEKIYTGFNYIFRGIEFPNNSPGLAFAGGQSVTYNGNGIIIKSTDGGSTWSSIWTGTQQGIEGISFPDANNGYVCGCRHYFAKTTNGGTTWTVQNPGSIADVWYYCDVVFKDPLHGIVGANGNVTAKIYATSDGGATWVEGTGLAGVPYSITHVTGDTYYLVTNGGDIQKSTDGGLTWTVVQSGLGLLLGINFYNPQIGIALGEDGWFHKTFDGGATWTPQQTAFGNPLWRSTAWKTQDELIMVGTPETIYRSTDAGATWVNDYPTSAYNSALYDAVFTNDGSAFVIGSQGFLYRKLAPVTAAFSAANPAVCAGGSVQFTDQSGGVPTSWSWSFPGGTPATSNIQNPVVTYSTPGIYNVSLTVTRGTSTNTLVKSNYIHVESPVVVAPTTPAGANNVCASISYTYTTGSVPQATSYVWTATPASAGTFTGTGTSAQFLASSTFTGAFTIKVAGASACGEGPVSPVLNVTAQLQPNIYSMLVGGDYCQGQPGLEVKLSDSDLGVNYQLFKNGVASGTPIAGTGASISFGINPTGVYTSTGSNGACSVTMQGTTAISEISLPAGAALPTGATSLCNNVPGIYTATMPVYGSTLVWILTPASAGTLTQPTTTTANVVWNPTFSGAVTLAVQGQNACGNGALSPVLNITVNALPVPVVTGLVLVCKNQAIQYSTPANTGSTYAWTVTNGTITSGQGTNQITVLWNTIGTGNVHVVETSAASCSGTSAALSVVVSPCTGVEDAKTEGISIYPNPASDILNVLLSDVSGNQITIKIYNQLGKVVYESTVKGVSANNYQQIDISNLNAGTYILQLTGENETWNRVFIKNR